MPRGAKNILPCGNFANGELFHVKSHYVTQNIFTGHDVLKRSDRYSNQTKLSKREAELSLEILLTSVKYSLKFLRILLQGRPFSRDYDQPDRRVKSNFLFSSESVKQSSPCLRRLLLKNFLADLKIFWEPGGSNTFCSSAYAYLCSLKNVLCSSLVRLETHVDWKSALICLI